MMLTERTATMQRAFANAGVRKSLIVASTFRSGSSYIGALMRENGYPGLDSEKFAEFWQCMDGDDAQLYAAGLAIGQTHRNGILTTKLMWPHRNYLARALHLDRAASPKLAACFPEAQWIFIYREDKIRQAVSFWRAKKSDRWHVEADEIEPTPVYDYQEIRDCQNELAAYDQLWVDFFTMAGIDPIILNYEEFLEDVPAHLSALLGELPNYRMEARSFTTTVSLRKQSDAATSDYVARYLEDSYHKV